MSSLYALLFWFAHFFSAGTGPCGVSGPGPGPSVDACAREVHPPTAEVSPYQAPVGDGNPIYNGF